ncbi:MAG: DUF4248 domain-containing protein, partial [Bacteroidales bacterium]|nr:DUF4248 domain-containing protein [Bacteroidales bacterium]
MYIHTPAPFISPPQICHNRNYISHITLRPKGLMLNSALPTGNVIINLILYFMSQFMFKQDLAQAYFPDRSKESAGKLLAREIHTNEPLMAELS